MNPHNSTEKAEEMFRLDAKAQMKSALFFLNNPA
jgi:hypothetical protein